MEQMYNLIRVETRNIPVEEQVREVITTDTYLKCLGKFLSMSSFSFENNNKYSYTQFFIEEVEDHGNVE